MIKRIRSLARSHQAAKKLVLVPRDDGDFTLVAYDGDTIVHFNRPLRAGEIVLVDGTTPMSLHLVSLGYRRWVLRPA